MVTIPMRRRTIPARKNRWPRRGSTTALGYGSAHQKLRAQWKPATDAGMVDCHAVICLEEQDGNGRRIKAGSRWHLGHTEDRSGWTGPEHERCSITDGARRGNRRSRMAGTGKQSRNW